MQPTYEELFSQIEHLTQQLNVILRENEQLKETLLIKTQLEEAMLANEKLKAEIAALKDKLNTNSSNIPNPLLKILTRNQKENNLPENHKVDNRVIKAMQEK